MLANRPAVRFSLSSAGPGLLVVAAVGLQLASNFVFHAAASRHLGPTGYATLGTLLNLMVLLAVPLAGLQAVVTRTVVAQQTQHRHHLAQVGRAHLCVRPLLRRCAFAAGVAGVVAAGAAPVLVSYVRLEGDGIPAFLGCYIAVAAAGAAWRGVAIARNRYLLVAVSIVLSAALRVGLGLLLVPVWGVTGAALATLLAEAAGVALLVPAVRGGAGVGRVPLAWSELTRSGVALTGLWLFTSVDVLLAKRYLPDALAGQYLAAALIARSLLFLPQTIAVVSLPRFAVPGLSGLVLSQQAVRQALLLGTGMCAVAAGAVMLAPFTLLHLLYDRQFDRAAFSLVLLVVATVAAGVVTTCTYFFDARRSRLRLMAWVLAGAEVAAVSVWHDSPEQIALVVLCISAVAAAAMVVCALRTRQPADPVGAALDGDLSELSCPVNGLPPVLSARPAVPAPLWQDPAPQLDLSIIVPFFNPGPGLRSHLERLISQLRRAGVPFEVLAVCDGSTDDSAHSLRGLEPDVLRVLRHDRNRGKGAALHTGFAQARGAYIGFVDADGDIDPAHLCTYLDIIRAQEADIVAASKAHPDSHVDMSGARRLISRVNQLAVRVLFRLPARDPQVGAKILRRDVAAAALPRMVERRFAFDLELFVVAGQLGFRRVIEAPVTIERRGGSTVTGTAVARTARDMVVVFGRRMFGDYATPPPGGASTVASTDIEPHTERI